MSRLITMWKITLLTALGLIGTACLGSDFADSVEGSWQMISGTVDRKETPILESHPITIEFEAGEVSGTASCNGYGGRYELNGSTVTFGDLAMTEMACSPQEAMEAEAMFADAIIRIDTISLDEQLTLTGNGVEMVFEAPEAG